MRDLDRWKDKVELQLDGRQIFFLFFGSALCACLIFVLGVVVGKRVEARAAAQAHTAAEDPLAALDELGNAEEGFTFHNALADKREARRGRAGKEEAPEGKAEARAEGKPEAKPEGKIDGKPAPKAEARPEPRTDGEAEDKADAPAVVAVEEGHADKKAAAGGAPGKAQPAEHAPAAKAKVADNKTPAKDVKAEAKSKGHFTLQLSAFATKGEATDFVRRLREAGYKPFVVESVIPGKGLMYRVRLGDFASHDSALSAKGDFERKQKMVAYVAKL